MSVSEAQCLETDRVDIQSNKIDNVLIPEAFVNSLFDVIKRKLVQALKLFPEDDYNNFLTCEDIAVNEINVLPDKIQLVVFFYSTTGYEAIHNVYIEKFSKTELLYDATINALLCDESCLSEENYN